MSDSRNFKAVGTIYIRVIEECSELTKEICKAERFGLFHSWPDYHDKDKTNAHNIMREIEDVERVCAELKESIKNDPRWKK